jgi:hypothetical protein
MMQLFVEERHRTSNSVEDTAKMAVSKRLRERRGVRPSVGVPALACLLCKTG